MESEVIKLAEFQISLAAARVNAGLTQEAVAKALNVGKQIGRASCRERV